MPVEAQRTRSGAILLITVLVVGVVATASASAILLLGLGIERTAYSMQLSTQAFNGAWTCMENAINTLKGDLEYAGNHDRTFVYGHQDKHGEIAYDLATCRIYPIGGSGNEARTICTESTFGDFTTRRLEAHIVRVLPSPVIGWWKEVDAMRSCDAFTGLAPANCGDGILDPGEECDEGAQNSNEPGAHCREDCTLARCGDGILDPGEECDDGNIAPGDGCDALCRLESTQAPAPTDYIAYWRLDETNRSADVADSSGNGYTCDPKGDATVSTSDKAPLAFSNSASRVFDGWADYLRCGKESALFPEQMTVSFWTKNNTPPGSMDGPICKSDSLHWRGWGFFYPSVSQIGFFIGIWNQNSVYAAINPLQWNHVAGTFDGLNMRIYVNGIAGTSRTYSGSIHRNEWLHIGQCGGHWDTIDGLVDDVRIYGRALSPDEIAALASGN